MIWGYYYLVESDARGILPDAGIKELSALCDAVVVDTLSHPGDEQPARKKLLKDLTGEDTLIVPTLMRFAQTLDDLLHAADLLEQKSVCFRCLDDGRGQPLESREEPARLFKAVSVFQRRMASAASKRAAVMVRARGRNGGRPKISQSALSRALKLYERNELSVQEITERTGVSKSTLYKYLAKERQELERRQEPEQKNSPRP